MTIRIIRTTISSMVLSTENPVLVEQVGFHEQQIVDTIEAVELPFMQALQREYGAKRGWRMCGPASVALSRILTTLSGVPIQKGGLGERLEIVDGMFDPKDAPDRLSRIEEQTYIRYYTGTGYVYYIDPIYGLLMGNKSDLAGAIQVEKYSEADIDTQLALKHNLHPFDINSERATHVALLSEIPQEIRQKFIEETSAALHDERGTMPAFFTDSGFAAKTDHQKTETVIRAIVPEWGIDPKIREVLVRLALKILSPKDSIGEHPFIESILSEAKVQAASQVSKEMDIKLERVAEEGAWYKTLDGIESTVPQGMCQIRIHSGNRDMGDFWKRVDKIALSIS